ncbi:MAG: DUF559 domain-containing protein [Candidatus Liptonbacteria bacterium]|nr:DUF559 domain-containing protein [Candidatus Liptonbacteria bacterium]
MPSKKSQNAVVLVAVLRSRRDLAILLRENWYRIPIKHAPTRKFQYLAFYQPAIFGKRGSCIRYYARVLTRQDSLRIKLLPQELDHPRARERYYRIRVGRIRRLQKPIRNLSPRRVSFGFTTLARLLNARDILQVYDIPPTEQIMNTEFQHARIQTIPQYPLVLSGRRYRLDFAVLCRHGTLAVECDNTKAHSGLRQRARDRRKDAVLKRFGWTMIRLSEPEIISNPPGCVQRVRRAIRELGGQPAVPPKLSFSKERSGEVISCRAPLFCR